MAQISALLRTTFPRLTNSSSVVAANNVRKNNYFTYSNQISQPLNREPKFCSADEALKILESGNLFLAIMITMQNELNRLKKY